ncbi:MAG: flagellar assembly protein FliW [Vicinamibacterales bacterium]
MTPSLAPPTLDIVTPFGAYAADAAAIITFAAGVPGFEHCRRFVLVSAPALAPFTCLHGLDAPQPSFLTIDPRRVVPGYAPPLTAADRRRLDVDGGSPLLWLSVVRLDGDAATVNLQAPIVVNPARLLGAQLLEVDRRYAVDHRLE